MAVAREDRIAMSIEVRSDLTGVIATRREIGSLGQMTRAAMAEATKATEGTAAAQQTLANMTRATVDAQSKFTVTAEQSAAAWKRSGGMMSLYRAEIAKIIQAQRELEAASKAANQAASGPRIVGPQLGPALPGMTAGAAQTASVSARELDRIPGSARTAAGSLAVLAQAAGSGTGSLAGLANATGSAAMHMASMSSSAKLAASAAGIGALSIAVSVLIGLAIEAKRALNDLPEGKLSDLTRSRIQGITTVAQADRELELARQAADRARSRVGGRGDAEGLQAAADADERVVQLTSLRLRLIREAKREAAELAVQERSRLRALGEQVEAMQQQRASQLQQLELQNAGADTFELRLRQLTRAAVLEEAQVRRQFESRDNEGALRALSAEQIEQRRDLLTLNEAILRASVERLNTERSLAQEAARQQLGLGSENLAVRYDARLAQIESERQAQVQATGDVATAEAAAQQKIRKLRGDTLQATAGNLKTLADLTISSNNRALKGVGLLAEGVRRYIIGARAAEAAVEAKKSLGAALTAFGYGNAAAGALHLAAAAEFGAAAALGFREALGGGGGGGGAGSGGGGAGSVFTPRETNAGGGQVIVLQTVDPFSREVIGQVQYELDRGRVLKRPIFVPPTSGLAQAG
jgi:hypothetical protein